MIVNTNVRTAKPAVYRSENAQNCQRLSWRGLRSDIESRAGLAVPQVIRHRPRRHAQRRGADRRERCARPTSRQDACCSPPPPSRARGSFSFWGPADPDQGTMGTALPVDPAMIVEVREDADNYRVLPRVTLGGPIVYYAGRRGTRAARSTAGLNGRPTSRASRRSSMRTGSEGGRAPRSVPGDARRRHRLRWWGSQAPRGAHGGTSWESAAAGIGR